MEYYYARGREERQPRWPGYLLTLVIVIILAFVMGTGSDEEESTEAETGIEWSTEAASESGTAS